MITRRRSVQSILATSLVLTTGSRISWASPESPFKHGVASGDPDQNSVVIWTRVTTSATTIVVEWEVSADADFQRIVRRGRSGTTEARDHTVKVIAAELPAGGVFYYRFRHAGVASPVGRTRTLPGGSPSSLGIALVSCSNYAFGHFNAYEAIANDHEVDFVLHTGDYIYEHAASGWGYESARRLNRLHEPSHEIVSLADYRLRHAQYKTDHGLQAMHAAHPFLACWDDHESANNPWIAGAENHQPQTEGDWAARRDASIRAYYEWMPVRDPSVAADPLEFWRVYRFGNLATLTTLETRHTARSKQIDYADYRSIIRDTASRDRFMAEVIGAPHRTLLSARMEDALATALVDSIKAGERWRLIGNAIPMARMLVPDLREIGVLPATLDGKAVDELLWKGQWRLPFYTDTWDGYPWARERFYQRCRAAGAQDLLVLTGDSHSFWVNQLADDDGGSMGIELGTAGVTSPGDFIDSGFDRSTAASLDEVFARHLEEVLWTDNLHQGYVRLTLQADQAIAAFIAVRTIERRDVSTQVIKTARITHKGTRLELMA